MPKPTVSSDTIACPKCHHAFPITAALQRQLMEPLRKAFAEREDALTRQEGRLADDKANLAKAVEARVGQEMARVEQEARKKAEASVSLELADMRTQLQEAKDKRKELEHNELALRKRARELEEREQTLALEAARTVDAERRHIKAAAIAEATEAHRLKEREKEKVIQDLRIQLEDAKRTAEQGSQQTQGEVLELELEKFLTATFPLDTITAVPKGVRGADVLQVVYTQSGLCCGTIVWESKRTKSWSDGWLKKARDDQREAKADLAVIVTEALPKEIRTLGVKEGVWVTNYPCLAGLAQAIRYGLMQMAAMKQAAEGKDEKIDAIFAYLTGPQFRNRAQAIIETFVAMKTALDAERRVYERQWAQREQQNTRVLANMAGMWGDLQGLIGPSMQSIPALEPGEAMASEPVVSAT